MKGFPKDFLILINHKDKYNIIKYEEKLFSLGCTDICTGGKVIFDLMSKLNYGVRCKENILVFSNPETVRKDGGKIFTMEEFDNFLLNYKSHQLEFNF